MCVFKNQSFSDQKILIKGMKYREVDEILGIYSEKYQKNHLLGATRSYYPPWYSLNCYLSERGEVL